MVCVKEDMIVHDISGKNVMVLGGAGFVGSAIVRELFNFKAHPVVYDNFLHGTKENIEEIKDKIEIVSGDILDTWRMSDTIEKHEITYMIDCVGDTYVPTCYEFPERFIDINVKGTFNFLMACRNSRIKRALYVSSTEVYGNAQNIPMNEEHPINPFNVYAATKCAADLLLSLIHI